MLLLFALFVIASVSGSDGASFQLFPGLLSPNFYATSCPSALSTIKKTIDTAVAQEARLGASLLRLHFHDCFVNGCDGSVLLDDAENFTGEKNAFPNINSIRGLDVIDDIKMQLESACKGVVSCADILTVAARDSVVALGGPSWSVPLGRKDSTTASLAAANNDLPGPGSSLNALLLSFLNKGFTANELVALSGSHTIGKGSCATFRNRIHNDANINTTFANSLKGNCPTTGGDSNLASLDVTSPTTFDNAYYKNLLTQQGVFHSDQELFNSGLTDFIVKFYASNQASFFTDFANAMVKMGNLRPPFGTSGQIRTNCRRIN